LKDSNRDKAYGCLNCGHRYSEINAQVGTILYCKVCHKYEQIVYVSESGISTAERLEKDELIELLSEGRIKLVDDNNDLKSKN
jgi:transcription elongation factor Elf1